MGTRGQLEGDVVFKSNSKRTSGKWVPREMVFHKRWDDEWDYAPTMAQWNRTADEKPKSVDQIIAMRLLRQNVADVVIGPPLRRLSYIEELRSWMAPGADALHWTWEYWCEQLGWDSDYMRRKWRPFLDKCEVKAMELMPQYSRNINDHVMEMVKPGERHRGHWHCTKCGLEGLLNATENRCEK